MLIFAAFALEICCEIVSGVLFFLLWRGGGWSFVSLIPCKGSETIA